MSVRRGVLLSWTLFFGVARADGVRDAARPLPSAGNSAVPFGFADPMDEALFSADVETARRAISHAGSLEPARARSTLLLFAKERPIARLDSRLLVALTRALVPHAKEPDVRDLLLHMVESPGVRRTFGEDAERIELSRKTAAFALAKAGEQARLLSLVGSDPPAEAAVTLALVACPPEARIPFQPVPAHLRLIVSLGDLRELGVVLRAADDADPIVRASALDALSRLGDERGIPLAKRALVDTHEAVRSAAVRLLIRARQREGRSALAELVRDESKKGAMLPLVRELGDDAFAQSVASVAVTAPSSDVREEAVATLGALSGPLSVQKLVELARGPNFYESLLALSRHSDPSAMRALESFSAPGALRRASLFAYAVRHRFLRERSQVVDDRIRSLLASRDPLDRAAAIRVAHALWDPPPPGEDPDPRIRRAAIFVTPPRGEGCDKLARSLRAEQDPIARSLSVRALLCRPAALSLKELFERAVGAEPERLLSAFTFVATQSREKARTEDAKRLHALLSSRAPSVRTAAFLAFGLSSHPVGELLHAFEDEPLAEVRIALLTALSRRTQEERTSRVAEQMVKWAEWDPDPRVRYRAPLVRMGRTLDPPLEQELHFLRAKTVSGRVPKPRVAVLAGGDLSPYYYDDDGFALVLGPADVRVELGVESED